MDPGVLVESALGGDYLTGNTGRMETIWNLDWRFAPAAVLLLAGLLVALRGDTMLVRGLRLPMETPGKNLLSMRGLRLALLGLSIASLAAGWLWHLPAFVAAGLVIGFEETLETSIAAWALREELREQQ